MLVSLRKCNCTYTTIDKSLLTTLEHPKYSYETGKLRYVWVQPDERHFNFIFQMFAYFIWDI